MPQVSVAEAIASLFTARRAKLSIWARKGLKLIFDVRSCNLEHRTDTDPENQIDPLLISFVCLMCSQNLIFHFHIKPDSATADREKKIRFVEVALLSDQTCWYLLVQFHTNIRQIKIGNRVFDLFTAAWFDGSEVKNTNASV